MLDLPLLSHYTLSRLLYSQRLRFPIPHTNIQVETGSANLLLVFFVSTLVMACLIITPAFSISFFDRPVVMHTFSAGCSCHPCSFTVPFGAAGMLFSRVIRTPLAKV